MEERGQQTPGDGEADAFGLGRGGKAGEAIRIKNDRLRGWWREAVPFSAKPVEVVPKGGEALPGGGAIDGLENFGGIPVEGLAGSAGGGSLSGDGAVGSVENGGGVGDAELGS